MLSSSIKTILAVSDRHSLGWNLDTANALLADYVDACASKGLEAYVEQPAAQPPSFREGSSRALGRRLPLVLDVLLDDLQGRTAT